jgi:hypothetical protein
MQASIFHRCKEKEAKEKMEKEIVPEEKSKKKKRQPYRKSSKYGKK